ncbi:hypothetical protein [Salinibacter ruber]|nr:hypothetical protein [Salinibacter ruber]MCS3785715.1 hypothetical protein [Salinibacter ruber]
MNLYDFDGHRRSAAKGTLGALWFLPEAGGCLTARSAGTGPL